MRKKVVYVAVPCRIEGYSVAYFDRIAELPIRYSCIYEAHMSPALNGSSAIWRFKHSNAIELCDQITYSTRDCHIHLITQVSV